MLSALFARLKGQTPEAPLPPLDARLAAGALLVRVARADNHYAFEEIARIDRIIASAEGLNPIEAARRRALCEKIEAEAPPTETFTRLVQEGVPYADRVLLFRALRDISLADNVLKPQEEAFLTDTAQALGIRDADREGPQT